jgi:hypothetical protein
MCQFEFATTIHSVASWPTSRPVLDQAAKHNNNIQRQLVANATAATATTQSSITVAKPTAPTTTAGIPQQHPNKHIDVQGLRSMQIARVSSCNLQAYFAINRSTTSQPSVQQELVANATAATATTQSSRTKLKTYFSMLMKHSI